MAADSADRLKELAESAGLPLGAFIERLLDCYQSDSTVIAGSDNLHSTVADLNNRVLVLESRLQALEAVGAVKIWAVEEVTVSAAVVAEPVDITAAAKKKALSDTELDAVVRDYLKRSGNKIIPAGDLMRQDGISFSQKRLIESRDRIVVADRIKATLER